MSDERSLEHNKDEGKDIMSAEDLNEFDDFEEGAEDDDFGDFNDEFEKPKPNEDAKPIATMNENVNTSLLKFHLVSKMVPAFDKYTNNT